MKSVSLSIGEIYTRQFFEETFLSSWFLLVEIRKTNQNSEKALIVEEN
jgi:hypothetical protein